MRSSGESDRRGDTKGRARELSSHLLWLSSSSSQGVYDLTLVSNNAGDDDYGVGELIKAGQVSVAPSLFPLIMMGRSPCVRAFFLQVKRLIVSYMGENTFAQRLYLAGDLEVELTPQVRERSLRWWLGLVIPLVC